MNINDNVDSISSTENKTNTTNNLSFGLSSIENLNTKNNYINTETMKDELSSDSSDTESFSDSSSESSKSIGNSDIKTTKSNTEKMTEYVSKSNSKINNIQKDLDKIKEKFKKKIQFDGSDFLGINEALTENFTYDARKCIELPPKYNNYSKRYMIYYKRYMGYYRRYMAIYNRRRRSRRYWTRRYAYRYRNYANRYRNIANKYKRYSMNYKKAAIRFKRYCLGGGNKECIIAANNKWNANRYNSYYKRYMAYYRRDAITYYRRYMNYSRRYNKVRNRYQKRSNTEFRNYGSNYNKYKSNNKKYQDNLKQEKKYNNQKNGIVKNIIKIKSDYNKFGEIANKYIQDLNKITNSSNNIVNYNDTKKLRKLTYLQSKKNNYLETNELYYKVVNPSEKYRNYSSFWYNNAHKQSVIDNKVGAMAWASRHKKVGHWLQIDLSKVRNVIGVQTQGRHSYNQWVRYFRVLISQDQKKWSKVDDNRYFKGNNDRYTKINNFFLTNVKARYVRIYPTHWYGHMSMRAAVIVSSYDYKLYKIPEDKRNYSSVWDRAVSHKIVNDTSKTCSLKLTEKQCKNVRDIKRLTGGNKRVARRYYKYYRRYIGYYNRYMGYYKRYMRVFYRYRRYRNRRYRRIAYRYRSYAYRYRRAANRYKYYANRYYQVYKRYNEYSFKGSWNTIPYGCSYYVDPRASSYNRIIYNTNKDAKKYKITNSRNKKNKYCRSTRSWCYRSYNKAVCGSTEKLKITSHSKSTLDSVQAWSSRYNKIDEYITFDLGSIRNIGGVVTQGRKNYNQWVTSFKVGYSNDNKNYKEVDFGNKFIANWDRSTKVTNLFTIPVNAKYIRIYPQSWYGHMSMRAAITLATNKDSLNNPTTEKPSWAEFRKLMLQQDNVGLRNAKDDKDTLSINDKSELSKILTKYSGNNWSKLFKNKGGTWDVGSENYLFQKTYLLKEFPWQKFYEIIYKNSKDKTYKCYEARRDVANFNNSTTTINNFFNPQNINNSNMKGHVNTETKTIPSNMKHGKTEIYFNIRIKDQGWGHHNHGWIKLYNKTKNKNHTIVYKSGRGGYKNYTGWVDISKMVSAGDKIYLYIRPRYWWSGHRMYWKYAKDFHLKFTPIKKLAQDSETKSCTSITKSESSLKSASYKLPSKVIKIKPSQFTNIYVRAEIKTPSTFSGETYKDIFLIGDIRACKALFGGFRNKRIFIGAQCGSIVQGPELKVNTNYLLEFDYNFRTKKATIWVDKNLVKQETKNLTIVDGFITFGSGYHTKDAEKFTGDIKSIQIYKNTKRDDIIKAYKNYDNNIKKFKEIANKLKGYFNNLDTVTKLQLKFKKIAKDFKNKANNFLTKANYHKNLGNRYRNYANRYRNYANRYRNYANQRKRRGNNYRRKALAFQKKSKAHLATYNKFIKKCVPEDKSCIPERRLRYQIYDNKVEYDKLMKLYNQNMKLFNKFKKKNSRKANIYKNRANNYKRKAQPYKDRMKSINETKKPYAKSCGTVEGPKFLKLYNKHLILYRAAKVKKNTKEETKQLRLVIKYYATYKRHQIAAGNSYYRRFDEPMPILPIILVVILLAAIGGGAFFYISSNPGVLQTAAPAVPAVPAAPAVPAVAPLE